MVISKKLRKEKKIKKRGPKRVSTKHTKNFISAGTGLIHPSAYTKSHLCALELWQVLAPQIHFYRLQ